VLGAAAWVWKCVLAKSMCGVPAELMMVNKFA
jgi:hypothetical protein